MRWRGLTGGTPSESDEEETDIVEDNSLIIRMGRLIATHFIYFQVDSQVSGILVGSLEM